MWAESNSNLAGKIELPNFKSTSQISSFNLFSESNTTRRYLPVHNVNNSSLTTEYLALIFLCQDWELSRNLFTFTELTYSILLVELTVLSISLTIAPVGYSIQLRYMDSRKNKRKEVGKAVE